MKDLLNKVLVWFGFREEQAPKSLLGVVLPTNKKEEKCACGTHCEK